MLDKSFVPSVAPITWTGSLMVPTTGVATAIPISRQ
jgi:hypothetical protein